jgi:hypothetical protein
VRAASDQHQSGVGLSLEGDRLRSRTLPQVADHRIQGREAARRGRQVGLAEPADELDPQPFAQLRSPAQRDLDAVQEQVELPLAVHAARIDEPEDVVVLIR